METFLNSCGNAAVLEIHDGNWRFSHDKIRETLLADLTETERPLLYRQIALAIETVYPGDETRAENLMVHWRNAGDEAKEAHYIPAAVERLINFTGEAHQAITLMQRGLELAFNDPAQQLKLYKYRGDAHELLSDYPAATSAYEHSLSLAVQQQDVAGEAEALCQIGRMQHLQGNFKDAERYIRQGLTLFRELDEPREIAKNLNYLGAIANNQGDNAAARIFYAESLEIFTRLGDQRGMSAIFGNLGNIAYQEQNYAEAIEYLNRTVALGHEMGHRRRVAINLANLGNVASLQEDYPAAVTYFTQGLAIFQDIGNQFGTANTLNELAFVQMKLEDLTQARQTLLESLRIAHRIGVTPIIAESLAGLAWLHFYHEHYSEAAELISLVEKHPATIAETRDVRVQPLLAKLAPELTVEALAIALERGKALEIESVVVALLDQVEG
ncbi:MAG: tetratricopeptide repeat protein [Anaerolineae bacterium]|nr:tetratricopeptide repeat protein [Anaerolineae bacterium]